MATIGNKFVDLIDIYSKMDGMGQINAVIELLMEMNPVLTDAMAVECNSGTRHKHTVQTGLPSVSWGRLYGAIAQSKGRSAQVEDTTGFVEALSTVDERLLKLSGNSGAVRLAEAKGFLEAMNQEVASRIFYGNTASDPDQFMGLAPRFSDLSAPNGNQIIDAGGTGGDNTSIWFVTWGENQTQLLYPKGTQAGVMREDMGKQRIAVGDEGAYYAYEEMFSWHVGLAVKDWRYVSRVANIDVSEMQDGNVALYDFLRKAYYQGQNRRIAGGSQAIYCNRDVLESLDALATNAGASDNFVRLTRKDVEGEEVLSYRGIPIRESDALINTEARVVAS